MQKVSDNVESYAAHGTGTATLEVLEHATRYNRRTVELIRPYLGRVNFELGAGQGTLSAIVGETHHVVPFELTEHNLAILDQRFANHPRVARSRSNILDCREWNTVDCIYSANVLEHVEDDCAVVRHCARLLKPSGTFVALVPAGRWLYSKFDRSLGHHRRYDAGDIERLMSATEPGARLANREFRYLNAVGALGWFVKMRVLGRGAISPNDVKWVERLLPLIRRVDELRLPFGQNALLVLNRAQE